MAYRATVYRTGVVANHLGETIFSYEDYLWFVSSVSSVNYKNKTTFSLYIYFEYYQRHIKYVRRSSRVPNITGVPNKSVGGNFFLKVNKTGGYLINKKSQIRTCRRKKHPKKNKISSCFIRNSREFKPVRC